MPTPDQRPAVPPEPAATGGAATARPGRRRDGAAERRILDATQALLMERPFSDLRVEHVAARAGVGKSTIYRRWVSKEALAAALLDDLAGPALAIPDLGDTRAELLAAVTSGLRAVTDTPLGPVMAALFSQIATNPEIRDPFRLRLVESRRRHFAAAVRRGVARGDLGPNTDAETAMELLTGPTYYRLLFGGTLDAAFAETVVDTFLRANGTPPAG